MSYIGTKVEDCEFPKDWSIGRLDEVCHQMKQGKILPRKEIYETGTYPVFGANGCIGYSESYFLEERCVLITCRGSTCGVVNQSPAKSFVTNNAMILFEKDFLEKDFLFFALQEFSTKRLKTGSGQPQLTKGILNSHAIPLPPLPEQKKIAHVLSTVQRAIEAQERIIETTTELKKALMHKLFTEGLRNEPQKQTEIGPVPESWEVVELGKHCRVQSGFSFRSKDYVKEDGGIPITKIGDIQDGGVYYTKKSSYVPAEFWEDQRLERFKLEMGDVLIALTGATTGKSGIFFQKQRAFLNQRAGRFLPDDINLKRCFLPFLVQQPYFQNEIKSNILVAAQGNISPKRIERIKIGLPEPTEQEEVASTLHCFDHKAADSQAKRSLLQDLFRTLLHELMAAKVCVHKVDV